MRSSAARPNSSGLIYLSVLTSVARAETLLALGDHQHARQEGGCALPRAESLGLRELLARCEYVLGTALRAAKDPQARRHYGIAVRVLEGLQRDGGGEHVLAPSDLMALHAEAAQATKTA